ncbi:GrpB family protein, partial [Bacillus cereus group sp. BceL006]
IQYEQLKIQLSQANPNDKHQYAEDKTNFITSILAKINDEFK